MRFVRKIAAGLLAIMSVLFFVAGLELIMCLDQPCNVGQFLASVISGTALVGAGFVTVKAAHKTIND